MGGASAALWPLSSDNPFARTNHAAWQARWTACVMTPKAPAGMAVAAASSVAGASGAQRKASEKCSESTDRRRGEAAEGRASAMAISSSSFESSNTVTSGEAMAMSEEAASSLAVGSAPRWVESDRQGDPGEEGPRGRPTSEVPASRAALARDVKRTEGVPDSAPGPLGVGEEPPTDPDSGAADCGLGDEEGEAEVDRGTMTRAPELAVTVGGCTRDASRESDGNPSERRYGTCDPLGRVQNPYTVRSNGMSKICRTTLYLRNVKIVVTRFVVTNRCY